MAATRPAVQIGARGFPTYCVNTKGSAKKSEAGYAEPRACRADRVRLRA